MLAMLAMLNVFTASGMTNSEEEITNDVLRFPAGPQSSSVDKLRTFAGDSAALCELVNHVRKRSSCWRVRVGMGRSTAARVVVLDAPRSNGELPPLSGARRIEELGKPGASALKEAEEKGEDISKLRVAVGLEATGAELENTAVLVLDFAAGADAQFAKTKVVSVAKRKRVRKEVPDWTPGKVATDATRHCIVGDEKEIAELVAFLALKETAFKALVEKPVIAGQESLDPALLPEEKIQDVSKAAHLPPSVETLPFSKLLPPDVLARIKTLSEPLVFKTTSEVHAYLRSAGVEADMVDVNPCLLAGILNCAVAVDATQKPTAWLDTKLHSGKCNDCSKEMVCTVRDPLLQPAFGGNGYDMGSGNRQGAVGCDGEDMECEGAYITYLCAKHIETRFESGKFHNHCTECPDFGVCIGDFRNAHCDRCGEHYFTGRLGFRCQCVGGGEGSSEDDDDDAFAYYPYSLDSDEEAGTSSTTPAPFKGPTEGAFDGLLLGIEGAEHDVLLKKARKYVGPNEFFTCIRRGLARMYGSGVATEDAVLSAIPTMHSLAQIADVDELTKVIKDLDAGEETMKARIQPMTVAILRLRAMMATWMSWMTVLVEKTAVTATLSRAARITSVRAIDPYSVSIYQTC